MTIRVRLAAIAELPVGRGTLVEVAGHRIALFRFPDAVYAIGDRCSHAEASLAAGELFDHTVECPRHGSEFDVRTGVPGSLPATRPVPVYALEIVDGEVFTTLEPVDEEESP
ncbi:MAG TPA: non-heme iron oxygenase ferredoxin subunit [Acidimicrobiia bacterium]|nr:non-heme iron oxygenase ferredoxin subunit [Acidimicrobiia bacterium]